MDSMQDVVEEYLTTQGWAFDRLPEHGALKLTLSTARIDYTCFVRMNEDARVLLIYVCLPHRVEPEHRIAAMEYLHRANYGLSIGNIEFDPDDGEVRFKTSHVLDDTELTTSLVHHLLGVALGLMDRYDRGMQKAIHGTLTPKQAAQSVDTMASIPDEM